MICPAASSKGIQSAVGYVAGHQLSRVVTADFNGDGRVDVLVIDLFGNTPDTIHVLLGNADGSLGASIPTSGGGPNLRGVVVGDFNSDGKMDIAVVDSGEITPDAQANTLTVFLGNGDGNFTLKASYPTGHRPMALVAVDSNNDGKLDLVVANASDNSVSSFLGAGDGSFTLAGTFSTGIIPATSIAADNLDADGKPDLVVGSDSTNAFGVLPGLGNGSFASIRQGSYPSVNVSGGVAIADMDGDGKPDLIFSGNPVSYFHNRGNFSFDTAVTLDSGGRGGETVSIADLNGDGHKDIVVSKTNSGNVSVILSDGHGGFLQPKYYAATSFCSAAAIADLHADNKLDLITVSSTGGRNVQVIRGNGDGTFRGALSFGFQSSDLITSQAVADFNGDGLPDIVILNGSSELGVMLNTGNYSFSVSPLVNYGFEAGNVTAADVNNDGKMDVIVAGPSHISTLLGNGNGTFQAPFIIEVPTFIFPSHVVAVGDFNGDGKPDIAFSSSTAGLTAGASSTSFGILFGNGDGTFQGLQLQDSYSLTQTNTGVLAADVNGDHKLDIVAIGSSSVAIYLNNGNGIFTTGNTYQLSSSYLDANVAIADLRGNGKKDIVISKVDFFNPKLTVLLGNGNGTFSLTTYPLNSTVNPQTGSALTVGDFDGDGKLDVAIAEIGQLEILSGLGTGAFGASTLYQSSATGVIAAADMAGGGVSDVVALGTYPMIFPNTGGAKVMVNSSANPAVFGQTITLTATVQPTLPGAPMSTGSVLFADGNTVLGTLPLNAQAAGLSTAFAVGTHPIHVQFSGDDNLFARSLTAITQVVNKAPTTIALTSSSASVVAGRQIVLGASVTPGTPGTLSGTAFLHDGGSSIATRQVNASGQATFGSFTLTPGPHSITITYGGDLNYSSGSSPTYAINVVDFTLSTPRASRPLRAGNTGGAKQIFQLELASNGGQVPGIHLSCPSLPENYSCAFTQQNIDLNGTALVTGTISQNTRAARLTRAGHPQLRSVTVCATAAALQRTVTIPLP